MLLKSWGSGQNALYTYLSIPFVASMGLGILSVRMTAALAGVATLSVFWLLARKCRGRGFGLTALFILAVNPWHIMMSRWALESNLLPLFLLLGIYFLVLSPEKPPALILSAWSFSLSLYAYGTSFLFLPPFLIFACFWLRKRGGMRVWSFISSLAVFIIFSLPIIACQILNVLGTETITVMGITLPKLTEGRYAATVALDRGVSGAVENYKNFLKILLTGSDGLSFNSMNGWGLFYPFGLPLAVLGVAVCAGTRKDCPEEAPIGAALIISFALSFVIDVNINRMNMAMLPIIYFSSLGAYIILCKLKSFAVVPVAAIAICTAIFFYNYYDSFKIKPSQDYFPGLGDAIQYACEMDEGDVFITNYVNQPYIFALFYSKTPPQKFRSSAIYINPGDAFEHVSGFEGFIFGNADTETDSLKILHLNELDGRREYVRFGEYAVCR